jgi:hypothetical protein
MTAEQRMAAHRRLLVIRMVVPLLLGPFVSVGAVVAGAPHWVLSVWCSCLSGVAVWGWMTDREFRRR